MLKAMEGLVVANFKNKEVDWNVSEAEKKLFSTAMVVLKNYAVGPKGSIEEGVFRIRPFEAFVLMVE